MADTFRAFVVDEQPGSGRFKDLKTGDLPNEKVLVDVQYSSLNYKDGLCVTGKGKIARSFPMVAGIDLAGTVAESSDPNFKPGDVVGATGAGLSESMWGGYASRMRVKPEILFKIPKPFGPLEAMAIGTAGVTAMVGVMRLEHNGLTPEKGEVLVTGAAGGVGSVGIAILAKRGYRVVASTGRPALHEYLKSLGAAEIIDRKELDRAPKPLEKARWAAALDGVGGRTLATVLATTKEEGSVGAYGLAGGADLNMTVMPFILRAVNLLGINYLPQSKAYREEVWRRLATDFDPAKRDAMTRVEPLSKVAELADAILAGQVRGRVVIDVNK
jgi:putative YhdH/YhfP family quinone oxidoreductase